MGSPARATCRLLIDDQEELGGLFDRQASRFSTLDDPIHVVGRASEKIGQICTVSDKTASFGKFSNVRNTWEPMLLCEVRNFLPMDERHSVDEDDHSFRALLASSIERPFKGGRRLNFKRLNRDAELTRIRRQYVDVIPICRDGRVPQCRHPRQLRYKLLQKRELLPMIVSGAGSAVSPVTLPPGRARF